MKKLLRLPSSYLCLPMLLACGITAFTYDLPEGYGQGILLLAIVAAGILLVDMLFGVRLPGADRFRERHYAGTREGFVALAFAGVVVVFCVLDVALFPVPLISDPSSYAVLEPGREHLRHVSDMCWTLPVVGLLCARHPALRHGLVIVGLVFPVLVIDRNRIFAGLFSIAFVLALRRDAARPWPWATIAALAVTGCVVFSVLGTLRSGSIENVRLPFGDLYKAAPQGVKWLLLYVSAGPYNFASMVAKHYANPDFLFHQLVPGSGPLLTADTDIPLDAANINVGTEYLPFLLAWGVRGAVTSMVAAYLLLLWCVRRLRPGVPLFGLLMFLRIAYVSMMSPFAPQIFIWMNGGFLVLCLLLQLLAGLLPNRHLLLPVPPDPLDEFPAWPTTTKSI
ncbi:hypothetical protein [Luteibacter yeojuensis]|uniref:Oligosaccharide repeat unit polymerase n=1 Tax=Luteibacter yeojuensis TaxID=345309 RepID=A0A7X5QV97_9GAMM|nr:hypothetical protein [Luteibacter yeojuensis]NID15942.1 hypothetical protein [Luteibacter yeojuensis]